MPQQSIEPVFSNKQGIVFSTDENRVEHLYVAIQSLVNTSSKDNSYDIVIFHSCQDISKLELIVNNLSSDNIKIRLLCVNEAIKDYTFYTNCRPTVTKATYYRIFIPELMPNYERVLYLDLDITVLADVQGFLNEDLKGNALGVIPDFVHVLRTPKAIFATRFLPGVVLNFCSGEMLMDIQKLREAKWTEKCLEAVQYFGDKAIGEDNMIICYVSDVHHILPTRVDINWLCPPVILRGKYKTDPNFFNIRLPLYYKTPVEDFWTNPKIIHYEGDGINKPWNCDNAVFNPYAHYWWEACKQTPFYEYFKKKLAEYKVEELYFDTSIGKKVKTSTLLG